MRSPSIGTSLSLVIATAVLVFPIVDKSAYHVNVAVLIGVYAIVAIGMNLLMGNAGQISLGQAAFFGLGAYVTAYLTARMQVSFWIAWPAAIILSGLVGYAVGFTALRLRGHWLAIATLGVGIIFSVVVQEWTEVTGGPGGLGNIPSPAIAGFALDDDVKYYYLVWIVLGLVFIFTKNLIESRIGRALRAMQGGETTASCMGIDPTRYKLRTFALSGIYAGLAGGLFSNYSLFISPESFSFDFSITLLCMVIIGGLGSVWGGVVGAATLTLIPEGLRVAAGADFLPLEVRGVLTEYTYNLIGFGVLMLVFALFAPQGIVGLASRFLAHVLYRFSRTSMPPREPGLTVTSDAVFARGDTPSKEWSIRK